MAHTASLSQLQTPPWALVDGELVPYGDVKIHVSAEALTRAVSVLEGVKGYWDFSGEVFSVRTPRDHYDRLCRSAALMHMPVSFSYDDYLAGFATLGRQLLVADKDMWFRTTLYVTEGHWGDSTVATLVTTAFTQAKADPQPMRLGVSTWRRGGDATLPPRVKSSANYMMARVARIEVKRRGYDDAIMLNDSGRVSEATAASVLIVDREGIATPPVTEGCLDSITVDLLEEASRDLGIPFTRRPIDRTELLVARQVGLVGTVTELTLVSEVDGYSYELDGPLGQVRARYLQAMRGEVKLPGVEMMPVLGKADIAGQRAC